MVNTIECESGYQPIQGRMRMMLDIRIFINDSLRVM